MKKNNKWKIFLVLILLLLSTGCTKTLTDENKKPVKNKVKLDKLPECDDFKVTSGKYQSLWESFFVKPLSYILLKIGKLVGNYGVSVIIVSLIIRLIAFPITKKTAMQSELMKKAQPELNKLQKK